jgi:branched-chain amino acid aminotransferase
MSYAPDLEPVDAKAERAALPGIAYIDGAYGPVTEAKIPVLDWGFLRSDATYDVVHVWDGRFFRLDKHVARFMKSAARLRLKVPVEEDALRAILAECVRRSGMREAYVEMVCTRGFSPTFARDPRAAVNRFYAFSLPFSWIADAEQRERGLHLVVSSVRRIPAEAVDPTVKNYHWLDFVSGLFDAYDRGGENTILIDARGDITEGPGFNVFTVVGGAITTPPSGVLEGITRQTALELCAELGVAARLRAISPEALRAADEVFITSTAGGIMAATRIDDATIGDGRPGPLTKRLAALYWDKHREPAWTTAVAY